MLLLRKLVILSAISGSGNGVIKLESMGGKIKGNINIFEPKGYNYCLGIKIGHSRLYEYEMSGMSMNFNMDGDLDLNDKIDCMVVDSNSMTPILMGCTNGKLADKDKMMSMFTKNLFKETSKIEQVMSNNTYASKKDLYPARKNKYSPRKNVKPCDIETMYDRRTNTCHCNIVDKPFTGRHTKAWHDKHPNVNKCDLQTSYDRRTNTCRCDIVEKPFTGKHTKAWHDLHPSMKMCDIETHYDSRTNTCHFNIIEKGGNYNYYNNNRNCYDNIDCGYSNPMYKNMGNSSKTKCPDSMNPYNKNKPFIDIKPSKKTVPASNINPSKKTVPFTDLNPSKKTVPFTEINPSKKNVPFIDIKENRESVPFTEINPSKKSVPFTDLNPSKKSVPFTDLNPSKKTTPFIDINPSNEKVPFEDLSPSQPVKPTKYDKNAGMTEDFFIEIKPQLDELFKCYPADKDLMKSVPDSKWVKVEYEEDSFYVVGILYNGQRATHICYGVPGSYSVKPKQKSEWLPLDYANPEGDGYWVIFQDAVTGETLK